MVWVYTNKYDDKPNLTIDVYDTRAAACDRLKTDVEGYFGKPFDKLKEIPYVGVQSESLYINADSVEYWNSSYGTIRWDVDEREVIHR